MNRLLRIVKVGGSLFSLADLGQRLQLWLQREPPATNLLIAGGGPLADAVRDWDGRFHLGQEAAHWLCVDLLDSTARMLHVLLDHAGMSCRLVRSLEDATRSSPENLVFAPSHFLCDEEAALEGVKLPRSWDVTSDSIAARMAVVSHADELVLLKSLLPAPSRSLAELGGDYFDDHFPCAAQSLQQIRCVDLTKPDFPATSFAGAALIGEC